MAKKKPKSSQKAKGPRARKLTPVEAAIAERSGAARKAWAARHPDRAGAERQLRKEQAAIAKRWSHKRGGTPETLEHASRTRQGALARLFQSGAIDGQLLDAGVQIAAAAERIMRDVEVRTASLETRIDVSRCGDHFWERLGLVRMEAAYSAWRAELGPRAQLVLAVVVEDLGISAAAARHHMHVRRARKILIDALERWPALLGEAAKRIDPAALQAAQAAVL